MLVQWRVHGTPLESRSSQEEHLHWYLAHPECNPKSGQWTMERHPRKEDLTPPNPEGKLARRERVHYPISPPEAPCRPLAPLILIAPGRE